MNDYLFKEQATEVIVQLLCGSIGGGVSSAITYPLTNIRLRNILQKDKNKCKIDDGNKIKANNDDFYIEKEKGDNTEVDKNNKANLFTSHKDNSNEKSKYKDNVKYGKKSNTSIATPCFGELDVLAYETNDSNSEKNNVLKFNKQSSTYVVNSNFLSRKKYVSSNSNSKSTLNVNKDNSEDSCSNDCSNSNSEFNSESSIANIKANKLKKRKTILSILLNKVKLLMMKILEKINIFKSQFYKTANKIYVNEGIGGFFKGAASNIFSSMVQNGSHFCFVKIFDFLFNKYFSYLLNKDNSKTIIQTMILNFLAALITAIVINPIDVINTKALTSKNSNDIIKGIKYSIKKQYRKMSREEEDYFEDNQEANKSNKSNKSEHLVKGNKFNENINISLESFTNIKLKEKIDHAILNHSEDYNLNVFKEISYFDIISDIYKNNGIKGFYSGIIPSLILTSYPVIQFTIYEYIKRIYEEANEFSGDKSLTVKQIFLTSLISKMGALIIAYPMTTFKTLIQSNNSSSKVFELIKNNGFFSLYNGIENKIVSSQISNIVMMYLYEKLQKLIRFTVFSLVFGLDFKINMNKNK